MSIRKSLLAGILLAHGLMPVVVCIAGQQPDPPSPAAMHAATARHRLEQKRVIVEMIGHGAYDLARDLAQQFIDTAARASERVEGHRLRSMAYWYEDNNHLAEMALDDAQAIYDADPQLRAETPRLAGILDMDRAQLAFSRGDYLAALSIYDRVIASPGTASPSDLRIAMRHAAMFSAQIGRYAEAVERVDALLASPVGGILPVDERLSLMLMQVTWLEQSGDLATAASRAGSLWDSYKHTGDLSVIEAGVLAARWKPVTTHCAERLALIREVWAKIMPHRARPNLDPSHRSRVDSVAHQVLVVIADTRDCAPAELNAWARQELAAMRQ